MSPPPAEAPPVDYALVVKRAKLQLGTLLVKANFISGTTLDAALKMQELVEDGKVPEQKAPALLKKHHVHGEIIEQYLNSTQPELKPEPLPSPSLEHLADIAKQPIKPPRSAAEAKATFELLQQAGLLTQNDIKAALQVKEKHGGDLIRILQAAGKTDKFTFESAVVCLPMIREGLLKLEQCVIVLQYCSRIRVDFDTAMDELNCPILESCEKIFLSTSSTVTDIARWNRLLTLTSNCRS